MKRLNVIWLCWLALAAQATEFNRVLPEQSRIAFVSSQMGQEVDGHFSRFRVDLNFDSARPGYARAAIEIDLASVDAGSKEGNDAVKGPDWFDVAAHPKAVFESTSIRPLGKDRYELRGRMTLHGRSREEKARFSFRQQGAKGLFEGRLDIKRLDYGIGQMVWGDTGVLSDRVRIRFSFVADGGVASTARRNKPIKQFP